MKDKIRERDKIKDRQKEIKKGITPSPPPPLLSPEP
jgi:hypothetical protein